MRARVSVAAVLVPAALALAACSSSSASTADVTKGRVEAKRCTCPPSAKVGEAARLALPAGRRIPFKDLTISCDYTSTTLHAHTLVVGVTFGSATDSLDAALRLLPRSSKAVKVPIPGAQAYSVTDTDGTVTLFAKSGDRVVSVVGDAALTGDEAVAVARVFF